MTTKANLKPLKDDLDQVHQWIDIAFDHAKHLPQGALEGKNHLLTALYKIKRELIAAEQRTGLRSLSHEKRRKSVR